MQADLPYPLPEAALQQLTGLVHLSLRGFGKRYDGQFPVPLARATPYLTHLDLRENRFGSIPTAIMGLERLEYLNISKCPLQLGQQCLAVLVSLPKLRTLEMRKEELSQSGYRD